MIDIDKFLRKLIVDEDITQAGSFYDAIEVTQHQKLTSNGEMVIYKMRRRQSGFKHSEVWDTRIALFSHGDILHTVPVPY